MTMKPIVHIWMKSTVSVPFQPSHGESSTCSQGFRRSGPTFCKIRTDACIGLPIRVYGQTGTRIDGDAGVQTVGLDDGFVGRIEGA